MGLIYMASIHLTIKRKHEDCKSIKIPLWAGSGLEINSNNIIFVFICHHQIGEKMHGVMGTKNGFKHIINIKVF
jgi:hypothetical protein